jgi:hypothetical protein
MPKRKYMFFMARNEFDQLDEQVIFSDKLLGNIDDVFLGQSNPLIRVSFVEPWPVKTKLEKDGVLYD